MSSIVALNNSVRRNVSTLQLVNTDLDTSGRQLATGKRVDSPLQDAVSFFAAAGLDRRADGLDTLFRNIQGNVSVIDAATKGLGAIHKQIENLLAIAQQVEASTVGYDVKAGATSQGAAVGGAVTAATSDDLTDGGTSGLNGTSVVFTNDAGLVVTINIAGTPVAYSGTALAGSADVKTLEQFQTALSAAGINLSVSLDNNNKLTFTSNDDGASQKITNATIPLIGSNTLDITSGAGLVDGLVNAGAPTANLTSQNSRDKFAKSYGDLLDQITQTSRQASVSGINLLTGNKIKIRFDNDDNKSILNIDGIDASFVGLGLRKLATGSTTGDFRDNVSTDRIIDTLKKTLSNVETVTSSLSTQASITSGRADFLKDLSETLRGASFNQVGVDKNLAAVQNQADQAAQQFAQSGLKLAVQADASALQLLR